MGATPAAGTQREVEFLRGFQWMPETTLKKVLRHCGAHWPALSSQGKVVAGLWEIEPRKASTLPSHLLD